jgi:hypothetical protein
MTSTTAGDLDLSRVGNIPEEYGIGGRWVQVEPHIICESGRAVSKFYTVRQTKAEFLEDEIMGFIRKLSECELETLSEEDCATGLGFVIVSPGILNISMWHLINSQPIALQGSVYQINSPAEMKGIVHTDKNLVGLPDAQIKASGAEQNEVEWGLLKHRHHFYRAVEGPIVGHESSAWLRFLRSGRTNKDKAAYLVDVYCQEI